MHHQHLLNNGRNAVDKGLERGKSFLKKHGREIGIIGKEEPEKSIYSRTGMSVLISATVGVAAAVPASANPHAEEGTNLPPNFDPTIPTLAWIRSEHVHDLTGRITKVGSRPTFEGSFSNVWKGRLDGKSFVAMKVLRQQDIGLERAYNRLRREVGFWWCLSHENIIPLLGLAKDEEFG